MLKVVLDTNVLIDGSTDDYNYGRRIIDEVIAGDMEAYANKATLAENHLLVKRKIADEGYLKRLDYFFSSVKPVETIKVDVVTEDVEDNKLVGAALACNADYLITADHHLLVLEKYKGTKIVRPGEFWSKYEDGSDRGWGKWIKDFIN
jgi:putative PIN family toxin of toxin-antitoxin system